MESFHRRHGIQYHERVVGEGKLGEILRKFRVTAGLSQEELANRSGVSPSTISDIERGKSKTPRYETLNHLTEVLKLTAEARKQLFAALPQSSPGPVSDSSTKSSSPLSAGPVSLAATLTRLRKDARLSIPDLAHRTKLSDRTIRNVEMGRTKRVQPETAVRLAVALGLDGIQREYFMALAVGQPLLAVQIPSPTPPAWLRTAARMR